MTYNVNSEAGHASESSVLEILEDVLGDSLFRTGPESNSCLSVFEVEEHGSEVVFHDIAGTTPCHVQVDDIELGVLGGGDLVELLWRFDF
jgi:hypothetical protein